MLISNYSAMKLLIVLLLSMILTTKALSSGCNLIDESKYECTGISEIPDLPPGVTSLYVRDSPDLKSISKLPENITILSLEYVGVNYINPQAISNVSATLKELHIKGANDLKEIDLGTPHSSSESALVTLDITNCSTLSQFDHISKYANLNRIVISSTNIQNIDSNMFDGLVHVTHLDISYNYQLSYIREDAFEDMYKLERMLMSGCNLDRLYGDYFDAAYSSGHLKAVTALLNPYQCKKMCDFTTWYWGHSGFYEISLIGTCTEVNYNTLYVYQVFDLTRYGAGCQPIFWIVFGSITGALILIGIAMCILVALCGINYREYCCCCFAGSRRNRRNSFSNGNADHTDVDQFHVDVPTPNKVPMYEDSPPLYEELTIPSSTTATTPATDIDATRSLSSS